VVETNCIVRGWPNIKVPGDNCKERLLITRLETEDLQHSRL